MLGHILWVFLTLALLLFFMGAGESSSLPFSITLDTWSPYYQPAVAVIPSHTPIQWFNPTASPHSVQHDGCLGAGQCLFDSGPIAADGRYTLPGLPAGRYSYHCELHPIMRGVLVVGHQTATKSGTGNHRSQRDHVGLR
jgi:plastocyanin